MLHLILAISIEIGSGWRVWLAFGHDRKSEPVELAGADGIDVEPLVALPAEPVIEGPDDVLRRLVDETLRPAAGARVSSSELFAAHERWGKREGLEPFNATVFGRRMGAIPGKERKGGRYWYSDVAFAEAPGGGRQHATASAEADGRTPLRDFSGPLANCSQRFRFASTRIFQAADDGAEPVGGSLQGGAIRTRTSGPCPEVGRLRAGRAAGGDPIGGCRH